MGAEQSVQRASEDGSAGLEKGNLWSQIKVRDLANGFG
jgi:hypothetical protein